MLREDPGRASVETLTPRLRDSEGLVVLDNCEHLLAAAAAVAQALLLGCPRLRLLATSRAVLGLPGVLTWRVPSLRLPPPGQLPDAEALAGVEAVRLFVERAAFAEPAFSRPALDAAYRELGTEEFEALAEEGTAMSLDDVLEEALGGPPPDRGG